MIDEGRRKLGGALGVGIAVGVLPGISLGAETSDAFLSYGYAAVVLVILTQLIFIGPSRRVPPLALLFFGALGFVEDALIWWLLSWLGPKISDLHVEGLGTILLAALITRAATLLASQLTRGGEAAEG
ncbi:phage holin family protein [Streptomyces sp. NPDC048718]|uniref:phage holin family protein n=1 Tax=Streptomyces sp. NPDC048718 TaxID=3365587 RepID=UPI003716C06F